MTIEDLMGFMLFVTGLILIILAFLAAVQVIATLTGLMVAAYSALGFVLCVTGFVMARSAMGDMVGRFKR